MPHLKLKPFDHDIINAEIEKGELLTFRAKAIDETKDEVWGVSYKGEIFLLQLKFDGTSELLKYDKITRPLKVTLLKEVLEQIATKLNVEVEYSNIAIASAKPPLASEAFKKIEDFKEMVYPKKKIAIEVGFGSGRHLMYQAKKNPDTLFIGLEIHTPSAQQVLKQITIQGIENIWIVNYDARLFLEMLPSNQCERIYVHFPVPWDKRPHRRVISKGFLEESMRVLKQEGQLELRTDSDTYFHYSLETFLHSEIPKTNIEIRKNQALEIISKYEARWLRQSKDIYDVYVTSLEISKERLSLEDFSFDEIKYQNNLEKVLPKETVIGENFFVHFERIYKIGENALLIRCSFGSFDRPEHRYITIDKSGASYYASNPIKMVVTIAAHRTIVEIFRKGVKICLT